MKTYLLALDQGTTSSRAVLLNAEGEVCARAQKEFAQIFPQPGWVEHDPEAIWQTQWGVLNEVLEQCGVSAQDIVGLGITNQRETTIVWDRRTGKPIYNAIVWQDRRTASLCEEIKSRGLESTIHRKTGLYLDPYFSASKIRWILDHVPDAKVRAQNGELAFGTVDSWLVWKLTRGKVHLTDVTNASRTLLFNIDSLRWDEELLQIWDIPHSLLPRVVSSSEVYAEVELENCRGIPIAGIAGDQQAALFGQHCYKPGLAKNTYGTGCFLLMNIGNQKLFSKNKLVTTIAWKLGEEPVEYALEGSIFMGGAIVQWLRDGLGIIQKSSDVEALARQVPNSDGVYLIPAFVGLGAPYWDPYATGTIVGLTRGSTKAHIARAALESMAFQTADVLTAMEADSGMHLKDLRVDGGATVNALLMQFQADILGVPVIRPQVLETTALGAAALAGLATGFFKSRDAVVDFWKIGERFEPQWNETQRNQAKMNWAKAIRCAQTWHRATS